MSWTGYLEELKERPVAFEFVSDIPIDKLTRAVRSWRMADVKIEPKEEAFPEFSADKDKLDWLWSNASFNLKKWQALSGLQMDYGIIFRLIFSGLIYPDGTYNEFWIREQLIRSKGGKHVSSSSSDID